MDAVVAASARSIPLMPVRFVASVPTRIVAAFFKTVTIP
jgi:hypothetical protein